jgi:hypothetical protein
MHKKTLNGKGKVVPEFKYNTIKTMGSGGIAPQILNLSTRCHFIPVERASVTI